MSITTEQFYNEDYFEGKSRQSPPHSREFIYPMADRTARFLCRNKVPSRVLDVGCAKGYLVEAFRAHGVAHVVGVDVSAYAVSRAGPSAHGRLLVGNLMGGLPFRSTSYDVVTAMDLFEHLQNPLPALAEIHRVLKTDGYAYLKICHPRHPNATKDPTHVNVQPMAYWTRLFRQAGFTWVRIYEADVTGSRGFIERLKAIYRRGREWAVIGTPADYKFILRRL